MSTVDLSGARWRKSSFSGGSGDDDNCVEVALIGQAAALRDSKNAGGLALVLPATALTALVGVTRAGR